MFRLNFTIPVVASLAGLLDERYKPDTFKITKRAFQPVKELAHAGFWRMRDEDLVKYTERFQETSLAEKRKNVEELICVGERFALALATPQITKQLKKLPVFSSRSLLADCFSLGLQTTLSLPSALFSLAHKTFVHPIARNAPENIPQFYVREKNSRYKPEPDMYQYFSSKIKCRPVLFLAGFVTSLFLLSSFARNYLQVNNEDLGLLEGKDGFFHKIAKKVSGICGF